MDSSSYDDLFFSAIVYLCFLLFVFAGAERCLNFCSAAAAFFCLIFDLGAAYFSLVYIVY